MTITWSASIRSTADASSPLLQRDYGLGEYPTPLEAVTAADRWITAHKISTPGAAWRPDGRHRYLLVTGDEEVTFEHGGVWWRAVVAETETRHPVQAGAPGHCPAEGSLATDCEGAGALSIDPSEVPHAETRRGRQMSAALAVAKICEHELPEIAHWMITNEVSVRGYIGYRSSDRHGDLTKWAEFFAHGDAVPVAEVVGIDEHGGRVQIEAAYRGVTFRIYYLVSPDELTEMTGAKAGAP